MRLTGCIRLVDVGAGMAGDGGMDGGEMGTGEGGWDLLCVGARG